MMLITLPTNTPFGLAELIACLLAIGLAGQLSGKLAWCLYSNITLSISVKQYKHTSCKMYVWKSIKTDLLTDGLPERCMYCQQAVCTAC
jgi:hypothetical protein